MKNKRISLVAMLILVASSVLAQQHIQRAFDALRQSKNQKETWTKQSVEKNPYTGLMEGMADVYDFVIENPKQSQGERLISDILKAFEQDEPAAYSISRGSHGGSEKYVSLAVGNSNTGGVAIGLISGSSHVYACFLDPQDSLRRYRYAYALEWVNDDAVIKGRIAKTYATTQKYRQANSTQRRTITINGNNVTASSWDSSFNLGSQKMDSETWLSEFITYKNLFLKTPNGTSGNAYATLIYKLCKNASSLDDVEKNIIVAEILKLKSKAKDEFIQQLFDMAIERLKKDLSRYEILRNMPYAVVCGKGWSA